MASVYRKEIDTSFATENILKKICLTSPQMLEFCRPGHIYHLVTYDVLICMHTQIALYTYEQCAFLANLVKNDTQLTTF